ncbi:hypothetical protein O8C76_02565 [Aliarcobacter butzleri]|uniref:Uncharacterized protein n=1 Tax=Aliarcobacter butzleri TaxID=28197 RepID=A0AAW7PVY4_9BACT|nr:hypothetical protein [Aliarcobacter butzleri]MDN5069911.1 hypothetical protein [Aliarcobacter butzleri]
MKNILKTRKDEIVNKVGENEFTRLQKIKLLKLMELEIQQLFEFWSKGQVLEILNNELGFKISKTVFYDFCAKNLKKDEISKPIKRDKIEEGVSQNRDKKKEEIATLNEEELSAIAMFNSKIDQIKGVK